MSEDQEYNWSPDQMIEVTLKEPDDFLKVRETLKYYIVHFKELFALDGKRANLFNNDVQRRNRIAQLLSDWGLVNVVTTSAIEDAAPLSQIKVLSYKDKSEWTLESKYNIGKKKVTA